MSGHQKRDTNFAVLFVVAIAALLMVTSATADWLLGPDPATLAR